MVYYILNFSKSPIYNLMVLYSVNSPFNCIFYLTTQILTDSNSKPLNYYLLLVLTVPLVMVRYESLFIIFIIAFLFILKKKFTYSFFDYGICDSSFREF
jgi:hypothetical protein